MPSFFASLPRPRKRSDIFINEFAISWSSFSVEIAYTIDPSVYAVQLYESRDGEGFACSHPVGLSSFSSGTPSDGFNFVYITISNSCHQSSLGYGVVLYNTETGAVLEFLSLDISFVAAAGDPVLRLPSLMIGATPSPGKSLQRTRGGCQSGAVVWQTNSLSLGKKNPSQIILCSESPATSRYLPSTTQVSSAPVLGVMMANGPCK